MNSAPAVAGEVARSADEGRTIVGSYVSPFVRKVLACLELKQLDYRIDPIAPFYGDDEYSRLSPLRRVPQILAVHSRVVEGVSLRAASSSSVGAPVPHASQGARTPRIFAASSMKRSVGSVSPRR